MPTMFSAMVYCIVGCNTGAPDQQALHVLACDTETGEAKIVQTVKGVQGTTYFAVDKERKHLYTMIAEKAAPEDRGPGRSATGRTHGALVSFALGDATPRRVLGEMTKLCDLPCEAPCHIALSPDESELAFAAYTSGTWGVYRKADGALSTATLPDDAVGPNRKRQQKAYAHQAFYLDGGRTLGICDLGCDRVWLFDRTAGRQDTRTAGHQDARTPGHQDIGVRVVGAEPGDGPRHAIASRDGRFLFVLNELSSTVTSYRYSGCCSRGARAVRGNNRTVAVPRRQDSEAIVGFERVAKVSTLPADFAQWEPDGETLATKAAAIKLTADGKILMASNRGYDSIAFYAVNDDGTLVLKNIAKLTGRFPRDFALMPGEKFMVVGHKMSNEIQVYAFDREACTLTPVGRPIACWRPLCFTFL